MFNRFTRLSEGMEFSRIYRETLSRFRAAASLVVEHPLQPPARRFRR
ncbi:hypothetical protein ABLN67_12790 [Mycobacterium tuberculosis]